MKVVELALPLVHGTFPLQEAVALAVQTLLKLQVAQEELLLGGQQVELASAAT
ncbi:MAG TPA: hypothetical protein VFA45_21650 [Actinomycetes bacterium]|nr:hypothetical protein [Actinomycetes bacterium]